MSQTHESQGQRVGTAFSEGLKFKCRRCVWKRSTIAFSSGWLRPEDCSPAKTALTEIANCVSLVGCRPWTLPPCFSVITLPHCSSEGSNLTSVQLQIPNTMIFWGAEVSPSEIPDRLTPGVHLSVFSSFPSYPSQVPVPGAVQGHGGVMWHVALVLSV